MRWHGVADHGTVDIPFTWDRTARPDPDPLNRVPYRSNFPEGSPHRTGPMPDFLLEGTGRAFPFGRRPSPGSNAEFLRDLVESPTAEEIRTANSELQSRKVPGRFRSWLARVLPRWLVSA
jgi:hypothetical protein